MQSLKWILRGSTHFVDSDLMKRNWRCERGTTVIEYAMIASLLAIAAIVGLHSFGTEMRTMYIRIGSAMHQGLE